MPSNPLTQSELNDYAIGRILTPSGELNPYMPSGYFLATHYSDDSPALWRLFDASYIRTGTIDPNRLGTGSTGAGNLYLADDGSWKTITIPPTSTLDQVTTAGNTTTNAITVGGLTVATNLIYTNTVNGRVGIGTTSPTRTLTVNGPIVIPNNSAYLTKATSGSELAVFLADTSNNVQIGSVFFGGGQINYTSTLFDWYNYPSSVVTHRMRLTASGNLLIGTTTDAGYKLDVNGTTRTTGLIVNTDLIYTDLTNNAVIIGATSLTNAFNKFEVKDTGTSGVVGKLQFRNDNNAYTNLSVTSNNVGLSFSAHSSGGGYITTTQGLNIASNHITNGASIWLGNGARFRVNNLAETLQYLVVSTAGNVLVGTSTDAGYLLDVNGITRVKGSGTTSATTALLVQNANASSSLVVLDNGNVGIGTSNPPDKLTINGNFNTFHTNYTTDAFRVTHNSNDVYLSLYKRNDQFVPKIALNSAGTNYILGNLGIGTTAPSASLHISGSSGSVLLEIDSNSNQNILFVSGSGNVGIGTNTPAYTLDVVGDIGASGNVIAFTNLKSMYQAGDEGGEIVLNKPITGTTIDTSVTIDIFQNKLRIFETGGANRGGYFDISTLGNSVGTNLSPVGWTGTITIMTNPPGQQNVQVINGIITNVT